MQNNSVPLTPKEQAQLTQMIRQSPEYRDQLPGLYHCFQLCRNSKIASSELIVLQVSIAKLITHYQTMKQQAKQADDFTWIQFARHMILLLKQMIDGVVWRAFAFDRVILLLLSNSKKTGDIDETVWDDLYLADKIRIQHYGWIFVNDLTTVLRYGDITWSNDKGEFDFIETKWGDASAKNQRAKRQRERSEELEHFLENRVRVKEGITELLIKVDTIPTTYHAQVAVLLEQASLQGYARTSLSDCLFAEATNMKVKNEVTEDDPYADVDHVLIFDSFSRFIDQRTRLAPYGIYPYSDKICFELLTGDLRLVTYLNLEQLRKRWATMGLSLTFPVFTLDASSTRGHAEWSKARKNREGEFL